MRKGMPMKKIPLAEGAEGAEGKEDASYLRYADAELVYDTLLLNKMNLDSNTLCLRTTTLRLCAPAG